MKKALLLIVGLSWLASASAAPTWHTAKIRHIYPVASGNEFIITFETDAPACVNTNTPKYHYVTVGQNGMTLDGLKHILSVALTAATTGKAASIYFDSSSDGCFVNRMLVNFSS